MPKNIFPDNKAYFFKKIYEIFMKQEGLEAYQAKGVTGLSEYLGIKRGKVYSWQSGRMPAMEDLSILKDRLGLSSEWLITQTGEPREEDRKGRLSVIGLVSSGVPRWERALPYAQTIAFPEYSEDMFAAVATGDTMRPAGIRSGAALVCDPSRAAKSGEPVYVERVDELASIRVFLGQGIAGIHEAPEGCIAFQAWTGGDESQPFYVDVPKSQIRRIVRITMVSFAI